MPTATVFFHVLVSRALRSTALALPRCAFLTLAFLGGLCAFAPPVTAQTTPPTITAQPSRLNLGSSDAVVLQSAASADASQFQWYLGNPGDTTQPLAGATGPLLVQPPLAADTSFWVRVSNSAGSVDSTGLIVETSAPATSQILFSAGSASFGQLGLGSADANPHSTPAQVTTGVTQISAGGSHSLFLKANGSLWTMGANTYGQLGDGSTTQRNAPVQIATGVALVSAGNDFSLFVKTDGSLWAMGRNNYGQLGDGSATDRTTPVQITTGIAQIAAGYGHSLFLKTDASLWAMGLNSLSQLGDGSTTNRAAPVQIATGVAQIATGRAHSLFIKADGSLWAMGANNYGQLGDGSTTDRPTPVQIRSDVAQVSAGYWHSLFVKADGSLWAMGRNNYGQLGDGAVVDRSLSVQIASGVTQASAGQDFSLFRKSDHSLWAAGLNTSGQLGDRTITNRSIPVSIGSRITTLSAGGSHTLFLLSDYTVSFLPGPHGSFGGGSTTQYIVSGSAAVAPTIIPDTGWLFDGWDVPFSNITSNLTVTAKYKEIPVPPAIVAQPTSIPIVADGSFALRVQTSGNYLTYQWYRGAQGNIGQPVAGATGPLLVPPPLTAATSFWVRVSNTLGSVDSVSLTIPAPTAPPSNGALYAAGSASDGQLGLGFVDNTEHPTPGLVATGVVQAAAGGNHSLFIKSDRSLWGMGSNLYSELGDGSHARRSTPVQIATDVTQIAASPGPSNYLGPHSLFIKSDGSLWSMGGNSYGQLGLGFISNDNSIPARVADNVAAVAAGHLYSLFLKTDGTLWATGVDWGKYISSNYRTVARTSIVQIASGVARISTGPTLALFIKTDGSLWSFGNGLPGDGSIVERDRPTPVQIATEVTQVFAGSSRGSGCSHFIKSDSTVWAFGYNTYNHIGSGLPSLITSPMQVATNIVQVAVGLDQNTLILKSTDGKLLAKGPNSYGQYGFASSTGSPSYNTRFWMGGNHSLFLVPSFTVTFDLGAQGTQNGGTQLTQTVRTHTAANEPAVTTIAGWVRTGWDTDFTSVTRDLMVHAVYKRTQTITFDPPPAQTYGDAPFALSATASSGLPVTFSVLSGPASIDADGKTLTLTGAGSVLILADQPGDDGFAAAPGVPRTLQVNRTPQTVTFDLLPDRTFGAAPFLLDASASSGLSVTFSVVSGPASLGSDGKTLTLAGSGSVTVRASQTGNANFAAATPVERTFSVGQAPQSISFVALSDRTFGAAPFTLSASAGSGLLVTFTVVSGPAALGSDGKTLTLTGAGSVTVRASQAGNANFAAATPVERTFSVDQAPQSISFVALSDRTFGAAPFTLSASAGSGLFVTFTVVSGPAALGSDGKTLTLTGAGSVTVRATQTGNANYAAAPPVDRTFSVGQASQTITFASLSSPTYGAAPFTLSASASSGLSVSFSVVSGPASLGSDGRTLTLTGAGSVTIRASQPGDANYTAATPVDRSFNVSQASQIITFAELSNRTFGTAPFALSASASSGLPVVFTVASGPASLGSDGSTLTLTGSGSVTIRASQPGNNDFATALPILQTFTVTQSAQTISFAALPDRTFGDAPFTLDASATSELPVTFTVVSGPTILDADGRTLTLTGAGSVTIRASQAGNTNFTAATPVERTFIAGKASQTISFAALYEHSYGDTFVVSASASSGLPLNFSIVAGPASITPFGTLTLTGVGSVTVRASQPGDANYGAASPVERTFNVVQDDQRITTVTHLSDRSFGSGPIALFGSASSGLPVVFSVVSGPASINSNGLLTLTGAGSVIVRASQEGNANYAPAAPFDQWFEVSQSFQHVTLAWFPDPVFGDAPFALSASSSSGLPVSITVVSGPASIGPDGHTLTLTGAGSVTLRASQAGDANYVAGAAERTFSVAKALQTIAFVALPGRTFGDAPFLLSASASSGLPVVFSVVSGPATLGVDGLTLTLTAPGPVTVRASQAGNTHFTPASDVEHTFSVSQTPQTIDFAALPARIFGDAPFTLSAAASSGFPVVFSVVSGPATLGSDGRTLTLTGAGPVTIRASLPGDDDFAPATPVEQSFLVNQAAQTIAFAPLSNLTFGDAPILLEASASSGLPVVFSVVSGPATLGADAHTLTLTGAGSVIVRAAQAGDADFAAATPVDRAFEVSPSPTATLTLPALTTVTYNGTPQAALATTTPAGLHVVYAYKLGSAPATATPPSLPGSYTVTATLDDPLRTTAQPKPVTGRLNIHPAAPALPTSLARTVAGTVDIDLASANPATGVAYQAKGLPSGLKLDSRTGRLAGAVTAKPGSYFFSVWALAASLKSEIRTCTLTVGGFPAAWAGSFEGLIRSATDELPVGKLQLITTATGSFTGSLVTPQPKTFAIKGAWRVAPDGQSATALVNTASYVLSLSLSADEEFPAGTLIQATPGALALLGRLDEPVRLASFTGAGTSLAPWRGSYLVTATTLADLNLDPAEPARPLPAGTGTATLTIAPKGTLSAKGKLADGSPWTASLETDPDGGYRWFTQPYATPGNYFASETRFTPLADFPSLYQAGPATDFFWHKPAAPKDKLFPAGFGPVLARVAISPAKAPLAGKFTVPFSGNEHLGDGLQIATDLKTTSRAFTLSRTATESYVLDYTKPARLTIPLVVDGDTLRTTARPTVIGSTRLLDLLVLSDGTNQACVHVGLGAGGPADLSLGVACWTGSTLKLTPALLAGSYTLHGHADTDLLDTSEGFGPTETTLTITPADAGQVRITLPGLGEILAALSGSTATALNLPQTLGATRLHAFKIVSDAQGRLALYTVSTETADPTRVSVSILVGARD